MADNASDLFLVRGSIQLLESEGMIDTTTLLFFAASGGSVTWTAPWDCHVVGVVNVSGTTSVCLSTDNTSYTTNFSAAGNLKLGSVIYLGGTAQAQLLTENFPISKNSKLFFTNNSGSNGSILVILAPAAAK